MEWMEAIKQLLYKANGISESQDSILFRRRRFDDQVNGYGTLSEDEYSWLEHPVFQPHSEQTSVSEDVDSDDADSGVSSRPISDDVADSYLDKPPAPLPPAVRRSERARHKLPLTKCVSEPNPSSPPPPCQQRSVKSEYVNVRQEYVNVRQSEYEDDAFIYPPSLFEQCSVIHMTESREELLRRLGEKSEGTYFIRRSRSDSCNVLSIHCGHIGARELKIKQSQSGNNLSIDPKMWFGSVEELLKYYSVHKIPGASLVLKKGFFDFVDSVIDQDEEEEEDPYTLAG